MFSRGRWQAVAFVALGAGLGYLTASGTTSAAENRAEQALRNQSSESHRPRGAEQKSAAQQKAGQATVAQGRKPNIMFIMGDDIGWMQPSCYHRGLMVGETPNIDRIAKEGGMFMHYYAESSCTAGRTRVHHRNASVPRGHGPAAVAGAISYLRPGTPCLAQFLYNLGYSTGEFGKNHLGDHPDSLPTAHGFQEFWGYLYHLDAMQQVSFPDINSSPDKQAVVPPMKMIPIPAFRRRRVRSTPRTASAWRLPGRSCG